MASVAKFVPDPIDLEEEIKRRDDLAESRRREKYIAARKIQAWIRGILSRKHLRLLHKSATTIQRHWRGYQTRIFADLYLVERVHQMWEDYYNEMATRIQAIWRGYWIRKTVLDIPKMRRWLKSVYLKNQEMVENMRKFKEDVIKNRESVMEYESMQWILFILFKLHHLLRTQRRPGVITRIDKTRLTFIEEMLKCFEYRRFAERRRQTCRECQIDPAPSLLFSGTYYEKCEKEIREIERSIQVGITPVFRSHPFEEVEKKQRELNQLHLEASIHNKYVRNSMHKVETKEKITDGTCKSKTNLKSQVPCMGVDDLYAEIEKMDCHLKQFHLKCPIHEQLPF